MATVHLLIRGKVQGVFFRATAKEVAEKIGIAGWVKNTEEGNVESIAKGSDEQIEKFIKWCKQGPPRAQVTDVVITYMEEMDYIKFQIIRD